MAHNQLDKLDVKILRMMTGNARKPFLEIARECGVSGAAVHQRIGKLQASGVIKGPEMLVEPSAIGYDTCAYMGFFLKDPASFNSVIAKLREIPEVVECHFTTGQYDLFIKIYARNNDHLLHLIHEKLQNLGLSRTESLISFKEVFKRPLPVVDVSERD